MSLLISYTLIYWAVLILVALGGMFSERSGVINIGLEGIMVFGALGGAVTMYLLPATTSGFVVVILTLFVSVAVGILSSLLLAVASINFKADQTLAGTAVNMLATAFATVFVKAVTASKGHATPVVSYVQQRDAFLFNIAGVNLSWFIVVAILVLLVSAVVLYKSKFGLRLRSCGEHPQASASVGISVKKMRYAGVMISGMLGGLGGIVYVAAAVSSWDFSVGVSGMGFLALGVLIFGKWDPFKIALAGLLFGFFTALNSVYTGTFLANWSIPSEIYKMLPYIISLIVLVFTSKKSRAPKAEGIPYDAGAR